MSNYDVIIVGNGIIAYSTAFELSDQYPKLKIAVVGPKLREGAATVAAGAMLNCFAEITSQSLKTVPNLKKFEMARQALMMWPTWLERISAELPDETPLEITKGTHILLNSASGKIDTLNFECILSALKKYQEPFEEVSPNSIEGIDPSRDRRPLRALWIPGEGCLSSHKVLFSLEKILQTRSNVHLLDMQVAQVEIERGKVKGISTRSGEKIQGKKVLIAAGAFSQALLDEIPEVADTMPRIFCGVGYSLLMEQNPHKPIHHAIRTPNRAGACGLHALPRDSKTLYIGASNDLFLTPQYLPALGMFDFLMTCAFEQIDQGLARSRLLHHHVGNRPASLDSFPLIGALSIEDLFLVTGTYRDGFHDSPLIAQDMVSRMMKGVGIIPDLFRPQRPLIQMNNKNDSIREYLAHFEGSSYEHQLHLPLGILSDDGYIECIRTRVQDLYRLLGTEFGLPPDVLFMFDTEYRLSPSLSFLKAYDPASEEAKDYVHLTRLRSYLKTVSFQQAEMAPPDLNLNHRRAS